MKWIKTDDRLPDGVCDCLIYYCEYWNHGQTWKIAWSFFNSWDEFCIENSKVKPTHWMPLPDAPK